jgi:hypothetical protein
MLIMEPTSILKGRIGKKSLIELMNALLMLMAYIIVVIGAGVLLLLKKRI